MHPPKRGCYTRSSPLYSASIVVFSLFGRKERSDVRRPRDQAQERGVDTAIRAPTTIGNLTEQREMARRMTAKIDQIESEMINSPASVAGSNPAVPVTRPMPQGKPLIPGFPLPVAPPTRVAPVAGAPARAPAGPSPRAPAPGMPIAPLAARAQSGPSFAPAARSALAPAARSTLTPAPRPALAPLEFSTSMVLGDTRAGLGVVHVNASSVPPEIEEAAILFANGQASACAATLKAAISRGQPDNVAKLAWMMLFDVLQVTGAKVDFESVALDYAARFERSPPTWLEGAAQPAAVARKGSPSLPIVFPARLDASVSRQIEPVRRPGQGRRAVTFDFNAVTSLDAAGAALVLDVVTVLERSGVDLVALGVQRLFEAARAAVEPGRRDEPDSAWHLALLGLRLLGEQQAFEDLAIDYCITYEVSPPSWEPLPTTLGTVAAPVAAVAAPAALPAARVEGSMLVLRGELVGRIAQELATLRAYAADRADAVIDCRALRRVDFAAAGELLNEIVALVSAGKTVLFVEPSAIIEALFAVMGIDEVADIRRRRI